MPKVAFMALTPLFLLVKSPRISKATVTIIGGCDGGVERDSIRDSAYVNLLLYGSVLSDV